MTAIALVVAAMSEVGGDYLIRIGLPHQNWSRMLLGALLLSVYGFAVNWYWHGDFSKLLGVYVVLFFAVSQAWGVLMEGETLGMPRLVGGALIVAGGLIVQRW